MNYIVVNKDELQNSEITSEFEGYLYGDIDVSFILVDMMPGEGVRLHQHPYEESVKQTIATRRAERQERYQQVLALSEQGLTSQEIAGRLGMKARTVREWLHNGVAPNTRPRHKNRSEFDPYAPYVLKRWQAGERSGRQLWREVRFQGYRGSERMVYRFLETLKTTEIVTRAWTARLPHYTSTTAVWLFMRREDAFGRDPTRRSGGFSSGTSVSQYHLSARPGLSSHDAAAARRAPGCLAEQGSRERTSRTSEFCGGGSSRIKPPYKPD